MSRRYFLAAGVAAVLSGLVRDGLAQSRWPRDHKLTPKPAKVVFGLITPRNAEQTLKSWAPFLERLARGVGVAVEPKTYAQQSELIADFRRGVIDFAWVGNVPALELVESGAGAVFGQLVVNGQHAYRSLLIAHRDSDIRTLNDVLRSRRQYVFGDGDEKSTSGHVVPRYYAFAKKGVNDVSSLFKEIRRGSHLDNLNRTARREVDCATNNSTELALFRHANPELAKDLRVVWESPDIPESPLVWRLALPLALRKSVQGFIIGFGKDEHERAILREMNNLSGFRKSGNSQLLTVADIEGFNARQRLVNDGSLSAEERANKFEAVIKRGTKLEFLLKQRAVL
jgi:phosphonate transport system substrate-binding protein